MKSNKDNPAAKEGKGSTGFIYWCIWLLSIALLFLFLSIFGQNGLLQMGDLMRVRKALVEDIAALQSENMELTKEIEGLKNDPFYVERVAREELNLVRPNEIVFQISPSTRRGEKD